MKKTMIVLGVLATGYASAQDYTGKVGINTEKPKATLDIRPKTTDGSKAEGLLTPQLTGDQLKVMTANLTVENNGLLVFVTAPVTTADASTANVVASGYYRFNISGTTKYWVRIEPSGLERIMNNQEPANRDLDSWRLIGETASRISTTGMESLNIDMALRSGYKIGADGVGNIAMGAEAYAKGDSNIAIGEGASALVKHSIAIGSRAKASGASSGRSLTRILRAVPFSRAL